MYLQAELFTAQVQFHLKGEGASDDEPKIIENYTSAEKSVKSNIVLGQQDQSAGSIIIAGAFENQNVDIP